MICTTYFLTFFSELIPPTGYYYNNIKTKSPTLTGRTFVYVKLYKIKKNDSMLNH